MTTADYLATLGVTTGQAYDFIVAHMNDIGSIYAVASEYHITNAMLGDIVGHSGTDVRLFFDQHGFDGAHLDPVAAPATAFLPSDMASLAGIVSLDGHAGGALSVGALRAQVIAATNQHDYDATFDPGHYLGAGDGTFSAADLGLPQLGTLPATEATVESLFYGTIVNTLKSIDYGEAIQLGAFITANTNALNAGDPAVLDQLGQLLVSIVADPATFPVVSDSQAAQAAVDAGVALVQLVGGGGTEALFAGLVSDLLP